MAQSRHRSICGAASFAALLAAAPAVAATQGSLGASSRGSLTITLSVRAPIRAAGVTDVALEGGRGSDASAFCLSGARNRYSVSVRGTGPGGALTLSNGETQVRYRVEWIGQGAADEKRAPVAMSDPHACMRGESQFRIALDPSDAERLRTGSPYAGALLLTFAPE